MRSGISNASPRPAHARRVRFRAGIEAMETRDLLATFVVTNAQDSGPGSLREAMTLANANPGSDRIDFDIPSTTAPGLDVPFPGFDPVTQTWRIQLLSPLPEVVDRLVIDGFSQAHFTKYYRYPQQLDPNPKQIRSTSNTVTAREGNNAAIRVILDGSATGGATGFVVNASHSIIRGLVIDGFGVGVSIPSPTTLGVLVQGNSIGRHLLFPVDPLSGEPIEGTLQILGGRGNALQGVMVGARNATIGGIEPQANNIIAGNGLQGVWIVPGAEGNQVLGNQIGVAGPGRGNSYFATGNGAEGVLIQASSNYVGGTAEFGSTNSGNIISSNGGDGVRIVGAEATRNIVKANYIGVGPGGGYRFGAGDPGNGGDGVRIQDAGANLVGGPAENDRNVISANGGAGVRIVGAGATRNTLQGNIIGLTAGGIQALGNVGEGVAVFSPENVIGPGNVISANLRGVLLAGPGATGNLVRDNLIGTDSSGAADLGNAFEGVRIDQAPGNVLSGDGSGSQVISGNHVGVLIVGPASTRNVVVGSRIGTDRAGTYDLANSQEGVLILDAPANTIGGQTPAARNLISANHWGVVIAGPASVGNVVQGNFIGTNFTGLAPIALGNELDGVVVRDWASGNMIGGATAASGNTIAFNIRDGVRIEGAGSVRNAILTNSIFANGLGINLVAPADRPPGITPNDPGDVDFGPNQLQNAPVLTAVASSVAFTNIQGAIASTPNATFLIQLFASSPFDPTGVGQGARFLGQATVTTGADGVGVFSADVPAAVPAGQFVTATATDASGNTSEFSAPIAEVFGTVQFSAAAYVVDEPAGTVTIVVTRTGGSGGLFTVNYATADGTALAGVDYAPASGTLTFQPGVDVMTFTVAILGDTLPEADETFLVALSGPVGAATLGSPAAAVVTIRDDDQPGAVAFQVAAYEVGEAAGTAIITVVRDSGGGTVTVNYATADGTARAGGDYLAASGTLTFGPGVTTRTFAVPILMVAGADGDRTVILNLSAPGGGATLGSPASAVLVIVDDRVDRDGPRVVAARATAGPAGSASLAITYDEPVDPARALDPRNYGYSVRAPGRGNRLGSRHDLMIGLGAGTYDPSTRTVTFPLTRLVRAGTPLGVAINAATGVPGAGVGVADLAGNLLDGDGDGLPGSPFAAVVVAGPGPEGPARPGARAARPSGPASRFQARRPPGEWAPRGAAAGLSAGAPRGSGR